MATGEVTILCCLHKYCAVCLMSVMTNCPRSIQMHCAECRADIDKVTSNDESVAAITNRFIDLTKWRLLAEAEKKSSSASINEINCIDLTNTLEARHALTPTADILSPLTLFSQLQAINLLDSQSLDIIYDNYFGFDSSRSFAYTLFSRLYMNKYPKLLKTSCGTILDFIHFCISTLLSGKIELLMSLCDADADLTVNRYNKRAFGKLDSCMELRKTQKIDHKMLNTAFYKENRALFELGLCTKYCVPMSMLIGFSTTCEKDILVKSRRTYYTGYCTKSKVRGIIAVNRVLPEMGDLVERRMTTDMMTRLRRLPSSTISTSRHRFSMPLIACRIQESITDCGMEIVSPMFRHPSELNIKSTNFILGSQFDTLLTDHEYHTEIKYSTIFSNSLSYIDCTSKLYKNFLVKIKLAHRINIKFPIPSPVEVSNVDDLESEDNHADSDSDTSNDETTDDDPSDHDYVPT